MRTINDPETLTRVKNYIRDHFDPPIYFIFRMIVEWGLERDTILNLRTDNIITGQTDTSAVIQGIIYPLPDDIKNDFLEYFHQLKTGSALFVNSKGFKIAPARFSEALKMTKIALNVYDLNCRNLRSINADTIWPHLQSKSLPCIDPVRQSPVNPPFEVISSIGITDCLVNSLGNSLDGISVIMNQYPQALSNQNLRKLQVYSIILNDLVRSFNGNTPSDE